MYRVLVTGVGGNIGQGVIKSLRAGKNKYYIVGIDMEPLSAGCFLVDRFYKTPATRALVFRAELVKIIKKEKIEAIYVCSPEELEFFSLNQNELEKKLNISVFVNPARVVRIGQDKLLTANFLKDSGFPYLDTARAGDKAKVDSIINKYGFPLIIKPQIGSGSKNIFLLNSRKQINSLANFVPNLIVQRYIPGSDNEYTAATISNSNMKVRAIIILHRDIHSGTTYRTELVQDKSLGFQVTQIIEALGAIGVCNLQFKVIKGKVFVFEINPRFSGTCGVRYLYGFNDSEMVFELLRLKHYITQPKFKPAVVLRYWNEIFVTNANFEKIRKGKLSFKGIETSVKRPIKRLKGSH